MDDDDADVDVFGRGEDCGVTLFVGVLSGVCLRFERRPIFRPRRTRDVMSASTLRLCAKRRQFLRVCCKAAPRRCASKICHSSNQGSTDGMNGRN